MKPSSWLWCAAALLLVAQRAEADILILATSGGDVAKRYPTGTKIDQGKITLLRGQWISAILNGKVIRINGPTRPAVRQAAAAETSLSARLVAAFLQLGERPVRVAAMRSGPGDTSTDEVISAGASNSIKVRVELAAPGIPATVAGSAVSGLSRIPAQAIELVGPNQPADIVVRADVDRIWIAGGEVSASHFNPNDRRQPPSVNCSASDSACERETRDAIALLARSRRVSRVLKSAGNSAVSQHMQVETFLRRGTPGEHAGGCAAFSPPKLEVGEVYKPYYPEPATAAGRLVGDCDQLWVRVTNTGPLALDVTPLYFAVDGSISVMGGATGHDADLRLMPKESREFYANVRTMSSRDGRRFPIGAESVALVAVEQPPSAPPQTFTWLATAGQATMRSGSVNPQAVGSTGNSGRSRGEAPASDTTSSVVIIPLDLRVL